MFMGGAVFEVANLPTRLIDEHDSITSVFTILGEKRGLNHCEIDNNIHDHITLQT